LHASPTAGSAINELIIGQNDRSLALFLKGFGRDAEGELYVLGSTVVGLNGTSGVVQKIVPLGP
jgi:hypothetical protein